MSFPEPPSTARERCGELVVVASRSRSKRTHCLPDNRGERYRSRKLVGIRPTEVQDTSLGLEVECKDWRADDPLYKEIYEKLSSMRRQQRVDNAQGQTYRRSVANTAQRGVGEPQNPVVGPSTQLETLVIDRREGCTRGTASDRGGKCRARVTHPVLVQQILRQTPCRCKRVPKRCCHRRT